ncbi:MAG TPA: S-layer homology domain-containing protein, partial [Longimicrobiales bacterium]|nr:S-layer homology domain-containing protein [Longimicrobiales bacterium]
EGITFGCNPPANDRFCPGRSVTREEMASFLVRALHLGTSATDWFTDDEDSAHEPNINALAQAGITVGCAPARYCPEKVVARQEMASYLARALSLLATGTDWFTDDDGSYYEPHINSLRESRITLGCTTTTFCPLGPVTREQMAAFLHRALG